MSNVTTTTTEIPLSAEISLLALQDSAERFEQLAHDTLQRSEKFQLECKELAPLLEKLKSVSIFKK